METTIWGLGLPPGPGQHLSFSLIMAHAALCMLLRSSDALGQSAAKTSAAHNAGKAPIYGSNWKWEPST